MDKNSLNCKTNKIKIGDLCFFKWCQLLASVVLQSLIMLCFVSEKSNHLTREHRKRQDSINLKKKRKLLKIDNAPLSIYATKICPVFNFLLLSFIFFWGGQHRWGRPRITGKWVWSGFVMWNSKITNKTIMKIKRKVNNDTVRHYKVSDRHSINILNKYLSWSKLFFWSL